MQKDEILKIVVALKAIKIPISKIEADLGFSNGLIGKAAKGKTELSEDKFAELSSYFDKNCGVLDKIEEKTSIVVEKKKGLIEVPSQKTKQRSDEVMDKINKDFGAGTVMYFGDKDTGSYEVVSTGSLKLDAALGIGGLPRGRIAEIFGWESSGKTTIALSVIANGQKKGLKCLLVDAENAFDPEYASALGVDVEKLQYCQPSYGEQGLEVADRLMSLGKVDIVVIDSVAALVPKAELEGEMGDSVTFDTPIYIKDKKNKYIDIIAISDLYNGEKEIAYNRNQCIYKKNKRIEVLTHDGWKNVNAVFYKKNKQNKKIVITKTGNGLVKSTYDHCLFVNGEEKTAKELKIGDVLDTYTSLNPINKISPFNNDIAWMLGQWVSDGVLFDTNYFMLCDTNIAIIEKLKTIIENNFITKTQIKKREYNDGVRKSLYILTATKCDQLDILIKSCVSKNSKLKKIPITILNASKEIKKSFLNGFRDGDGSKIKDGYRYYNKSMPVMAGIQFLTTSLGIETNLTISKEKPELLTLSERSKKIFKDGEIKRFYELKESPNFIYDIETDAGTFVSALGNIVIHNSKMGLHARLMSQALRKMVGTIAKHNCICIFINQFRHKIGVMYGSPDVTTGGNALQFYASIRMEVRRSTTSANSVMSGDVKEGNQTTVKVIKNKCSPPFRQAVFNIMYGTGIDNVGELVDLAVENGIIEKSGSWYSYKGDKLGQGTSQIKQLFIDNEELRNEIQSKLP